MVLAITPLRRIYKRIKSDSMTLPDAFLDPCGRLARDAETGNKFDIGSDLLAQ